MNDSPHALLTTALQIATFSKLKLSIKRNFTKNNFVEFINVAF
jgi:hypothetical protein